MYIGFKKMDLKSRNYIINILKILNLHKFIHYIKKIEEENNN